MAGDRAGERVRVLLNGDAGTLRGSDVAAVVSSVAAVQESGVAEHINHISTGGGAALEMIEGKILPGVAALYPSEPRGA